MPKCYKLFIVLTLWSNFSHATTRSAGACGRGQVSHFGMHKEKKYKVVGYFPNWMFSCVGKNGGLTRFTPSDIKASYRTHINYAFAKPYTSDVNHKVVSYEASLMDPSVDAEYGKRPNSLSYAGNFAQLYELKKKYPHVKTLLSFGGWAVCDEGLVAEKFSHLASRPALRKLFIESAVKLCLQYDFDGIDIDWEYPGFNGGRAEDTKNYTLLLQELHSLVKDSKKLNKLCDLLGKPHKESLLLTVALPVGENKIASIEIEKIYPLVDFINLMTYNFHGSWSKVTHHNAPLYATDSGSNKLNIDSVVNMYLSRGVPPKKLILGMPLYGRTFSGVDSSKDGLYAPFKGPGKGTAVTKPGAMMYYEIVQNALSCYKRYWDNVAKVPYLFNALTKEFISYDDKESLEVKTRYLKEHQLGGAMFWPLAKEDKQWKIVRAVSDMLKE